MHCCRNCCQGRREASRLVKTTVDFVKCRSDAGIPLDLHISEQIFAKPRQRIDHANKEMEMLLQEPFELRAAQGVMAQLLAQWEQEVDHDEAERQIVESACEEREQALLQLGRSRQEQHNKSLLDRKRFDESLSRLEPAREASDSEAANSDRLSMPPLLAQLTQTDARNDSDSGVAFAGNHLEDVALAFAGNHDSGPSRKRARTAVSPIG